MNKKVITVYNRFKNYKFGISFRLTMLDIINKLLSIFKGRHLNKAKGSMYWSINELRDKIIYDFLVTNFKYITDKYLDSDFRNSKVIEGDGQTIWVCWWQGEDQMPPIVKKTYSSIKRNAGDCTVVLITKDNYTSYIDIDNIIISKLNSGKLSIQYFSDILRSYLLAKYGGLWIDSTILMTAPINSDDFNKPFYSIKLPPIANDSVTYYRWAGFCLGSNGKMAFFNCLKDLLEAYALKYDGVIHYLLIDYMIDLMIQQNDDYALIVNELEYSHLDLYTLSQKVNEKFDKIEYERICEHTPFFKMTYRQQLFSTTDNGEITYFGYIINQ